jgi:L-alanine-DL-glutamate epimerase-like enolase superfamily enzyme
MQIKARRVDWEFKSAFSISYKTRTHAQTVLVELSDGPFVGRGEAAGVSYRGETVDSLLEQISAVQSDIRNGMTRHDLQARLTPGGARNALDCAFWDLEAKRTGRRAWALAGMECVRPISTDITVGLDAPARMADAAAAARSFARLKIKLAGEGDLERIAAIRKARPDAELIVDANQAWNEQQLYDFVPELARLGVTLIEQPLPIGKDDVLAGFASPIPLCADESCQTTDSLEGLVGKYNCINIKLDKTGGLTEALRLAQRARDRGFALMVGCMGGSSLSIAPAFVVGQLCDFVDLDGPLLLKNDVLHCMRYEGSMIPHPKPGLWG